MIKTADDLISEAQRHIQCLDPVAAKALYETSNRGVIIDVRESTSVAKAKLCDSVNIPRGLLEMKVPKHCPDPQTLILTHCGGGGRASMAAFTLKQMGYLNVYAITARFEDIKNTFG